MYGDQSQAHQLPQHATGLRTAKRLDFLLGCGLAVGDQGEHVQSRRRKAGLARGAVQTLENGTIARLQDQLIALFAHLNAIGPALLAIIAIESIDKVAELLDGKTPYCVGGALGSQRAPPTNSIASTIRLSGGGADESSLWVAILSDSDTSSS